ncbi:MAG: DUF4919 domain-containing protein [Bryobacteraceae bacterium]
MILRKLTLLGALVVASLAYGADDLESAYQELVERVTKGDPAVDGRALRMACLQASRCDARGENKDLLALRQELQSKNFKKAADMAEKMIKRGFVNIRAHAMAAQAFGGLGNKEKAKFHDGVTSMLIRSILSSGDGKSQATAFEVIGTFEEYITMEVLGLPPFGQQSLITGTPHNWDRIEVNDPKSGAKVAVFFNIDAFYPPKL